MWDLLDKIKNFFSALFSFFKGLNFVRGIIGDIKKPEATLSGLDLKAVNRDSIEYEVKIDVNNPYPVSLPIMGISYTLKSNGRMIVSGKMEDPGSLKAKDKTLLKIEVKVPYNILVSLAKDIGSDWDIDYGIQVGLSIDLPVIGEFTIPLSTKGQIKLPTLSDVF